MNEKYTNEELQNLGFKEIGENVSISKTASILEADKITIGENVEIDDYCTIQGNITIGDNVFLTAHTCIIAQDNNLKIENVSEHDHKSSSLDKAEVFNFTKDSITESNNTETRTSQQTKSGHAFIAPKIIKKQEPISTKPTKVVDFTKTEKQATKVDQTKIKQTEQKSNLGIVNQPLIKKQKPVSGIDKISEIKQKAAAHTIKNNNGQLSSKKDIEQDNTSIFESAVKNIKKPSKFSNTENPVSADSKAEFPFLKNNTEKANKHSIENNKKIEDQNKIYDVSPKKSNNKTEKKYNNKESEIFNIKNNKFKIFDI